MRLIFHQPRATLIRESTVDSGERNKAGELIWPSGLGSQASLKILTDFPLLILQKEPFSIKSLDQRILFQAKEPEEDFASKIEQFGKYFALKTL